MESVSLKLDSALVREIGRAMKFAHYSTKTEFIREAIRKRLAEINEEKKKEVAWERLFAMRGILKGKGKFKTYDEWHDWRTNVYSKKLEKELEEEFSHKH